jgi:hypothetical protein
MNTFSVVLQQVNTTGVDTALAVTVWALTFLLCLSVGYLAGSAYAGRA